MQSQKLNRVGSILPTHKAATYETPALMSRPSTGTPIFIAGLVQATNSGTRSRISGSAIHGADDVGCGKGNRQPTEDLKQRVPVDKSEGRRDTSADECHRTSWTLDADETMQPLLQEP